MKSIFTIFAFALSLTSQLSQAGVPPVKKGTEIHFIKGLSAKKQETNYWCWAAASQMVLSKYLPKKPEQCQIVSKALNANCCVEKFKMPLACRTGQWPEKVLRTYGLDSRMVAGASFRSVQKEVLADRPTIIVINPGGTQHATVAYATFESSDGNDYIILWDPYTDKKHFVKSNTWDAAVFSSK